MRRNGTLWLLLALAALSPGCHWACASDVIATCERACGALGVREVDLTTPSCVCMTGAERTGATEIAR